MKQDSKITRYAEPSKVKDFKQELLATIATIGMALLFVACSEKIVYKDVLIPIKCDVAVRKKPILSQDSSPALNVRKVLIYTEGLENDLNYCKGIATKTNK